MEEGKKGRKGRQKKDLADLVVNHSSTDDDSDHCTPVLVKNTKKKDNKKPSSKGLVSADKVDSDEDSEVVRHKPKKFENGKISMFQVLDIEDIDQDTDEQNSSIPMKKGKQNLHSEDDESDNNSIKLPVKKVAKKIGKKSKHETKKANEEDIEAILAEISGLEVSGPESKRNKGKDTCLITDNKTVLDHSDIVLCETLGLKVRTPETKGKNKRKDEDQDNVLPSCTPVEESNTQTLSINLMSQEEIAKIFETVGEFEDDKKTKKKQMQEDDVDNEDYNAESSTVKTAAQKKKEKKERQKMDKQKKGESKDKVQPKTQEDFSKQRSDVRITMDEEKNAQVENTDGVIVVKEDCKVEEIEESESRKSKKDKKKKKGEKEEKEKEKKPSKLAKGILEIQKKIKEEEERLRKDEEERIRKAEEAEREREEKERLECERKEREKQKKKNKIEQLKKEGKYLTAKQKEDKKRAQQMLEAIKAQGVEVPQLGGESDKPKKKVIYDSKRKKRKPLSVELNDDAKEEIDVTSPSDEVEALLEDEVQGDTKESSPVQGDTKESSPDILEESLDSVKDAWDASSEEEEGSKIEAPLRHSVPEPEKKEIEGSIESRSEESSSDEESETESSSQDDDDTKSAQEKLKEKTLQRMQKRKEDNEAKRTLELLRAPVVCVLGHVDTGKTKILDKLRRTNVQDGEAGGITQQIGATNVPQETIKEQTKMCKDFMKQELKLPGLLIIDTPGHESFSNLRNRGSSLCDIAILVVDIMHGLEPQTVESINLLKQRKTPFVVALNKIDRLFQWQTNPHTDIVNTLKKQKTNTKMEFDDRVKSVVVQFAEQGLNTSLFYENKNPREYISMVPTSAHSGDGMGNLIALICELTQSMLAKRLMYSNELQATVMEVKALPGLGTTLDIILVSGRLHEGDTIIVAGQEGPIVTPIRALLMPQPLRELRVKCAYEHHKEVVAAQGCKIIAKDLEKALAGLPLFVACQTDEINIYKDEISQMLSEVLNAVKVSERGVFVQASTLGSLEALLEFLKTSQIPYAGINIGPVHKRDIMKASVMLEHDSQYAVILAFDVKIEREAQELADSLGVKIFSADIIYHLFDKFTTYRDELKKQKQEEFKHLAVFPCKLKIMPQYIFNSRDPIVMGVSVEAGFLKVGTMLCVPSKEFVEVGRVSSIEINHKPVEKATRGQEVCIKIDAVPGESPKMYGRHFEDSDFLVSKVSRQSIDVVKDYFREEMSKADWQLMLEMKKIFEIL